jgi:hypothetical protein
MPFAIRAPVSAPVAAKVRACGADGGRWGEELFVPPRPWAPSIDACLPADECFGTV